MSEPYFHRRFRTVPASLMLQVLGASLARIKEEDGAIDADLGQVLGKSDDRVAAYRTADGDMGAVSFLRGCAAWDGRFANDVLALVGMRLVPIEAGPGTDAGTVSALCDFAARLATALEDGTITNPELDAMWPAAERVLAHIERLRRRRSTALLTGPPNTS